MSGDPCHTCPGKRNDVPGTWYFYSDSLVFVPDDIFRHNTVATRDHRIIDQMRRALDVPPDPGANSAE